MRKKAPVDLFAYKSARNTSIYHKLRDNDMLLLVKFDLLHPVAKVEVFMRPVTRRATGVSLAIAHLAPVNCQRLSFSFFF